MEEAIIMKEVTQMTSINDDLNVIVLIIGLGISIVFFVLYYTKLKSKQLLNYTPNVWTSLGILGTFIAIVKSLGATGSNNLSDVNTLVSNIIPAFETSIIGIIGAIFSSIIIKIIYAIEEKKETERYIYEVGHNIEPEIVLNKILNSIESNNQAVSVLVESANNQERNLQDFLENHLVKLHEFYDGIFNSNKEQVQALSNEYIKNVHEIMENANNVINDNIIQLVRSNSESIQNLLNEERFKLNEIADGIMSFLNGVPDSIEDVKTEFIDSLRNAIIEKYNQLLEGNNAFTKELLERVKTFEANISQNSVLQYQKTLDDAREEIQRIIVLLETSLNIQSSAIKNLTSSFSTDVNKIITSLNKSSNDYEIIVEQINKLLPALNLQVEHLEKNMAISEQSNIKIVEIFESLEEVVKKNQQLRYELMQWKRVHKKVKIDDKKGTKECPNCEAENPMDANFCRKCNFGFWDCSTIASSLK